MSEKLGKFYEPTAPRVDENGEWKTIPEAQLTIDDLMAEVQRAAAQDIGSVILGGPALRNGSN